MTHEYKVVGITCEGCVSKIKTLLEKVPGVTTAAVGLDGKVQVTMSHHIATPELQAVLKDHSKYQLTEITASTMSTPAPVPEEDTQRTFWQIYKPILLVFGYILGTTLLVEAATGAFDWIRWMRHFMAGFFLVFSFFKMLDVSAFATSYGSYDVMTRRWPVWGYVYPFVELGLGILFLINFNPLITNGLTLVVMGISTVGVVQSLLAKHRFQCACLGAVFHLPMSTLTLLEDLLMVTMSAGMLVMLLL